MCFGFGGLNEFKIAQSRSICRAPKAKGTFKRKIYPDMFCSPTVTGNPLDRAQH